jgi:hypothetical protein
MKLKSMLFAVLGGTALLAAAPAFAERGHHDHGKKHYGKSHHPHSRHFHAPRAVVRVPPRVVYYAPRVYHRVYHRPAPVYSRAPAYPISSGISILFKLPL